MAFVCVLSLLLFWTLIKPRCRTTTPKQVKRGGRDKIGWMLLTSDGGWRDRKQVWYIA